MSQASKATFIMALAALFAGCAHPATSPPESGPSEPPGADRTTATNGLVVNGTGFVVLDIDIPIDMEPFVWFFDPESSWVLAGPLESPRPCNHYPVAVVDTPEAGLFTRLVGAGPYLFAGALDADSAVGFATGENATRAKGIAVAGKLSHERMDLKPSGPGQLEGRETREITEPTLAIALVGSYQDIRHPLQSSSIRLALDGESCDEQEKTEFIRRGGGADWLYVASFATAGTLDVEIALTGQFDPLAPPNAAIVLVQEPSLEERLTKS